MSFAPRILLNGQPAGILAIDDTGNYNAGSNPGGWGTPNPAKSDVIRILLAQSRLSVSPPGGIAFDSVAQTAYLTGAGTVVEPGNGRPYDDGVFDIHARIGFSAPGTLTAVAGSLQFTLANADTVFAAAIGFTIDSLDPTIIYFIDRTKPLTNGGGWVTTALPAATSLVIIYYFDAQSYSLIYQNGLQCLNRDIATLAKSCGCCEGEDLNALMCRYAQYLGMLEDFVAQDYARADQLAISLQQQCYSAGVCQPLNPPTDIPATLNASPVITMQPQSQSVAIGGNVTLSITATGTEPLKYQWRKNGIDIPGAIDRQLILLNADQSDGAVYSCVAYNAYGYAISQGATITLGTPVAGLIITQQPANVITQLEQLVTFTVVATGGAPITYQWRKDGVNLVGQTGSTCVFTPHVLGAAGSYDCVVSNPVSSVTSNVATLIIGETVYSGVRGAPPAVVSDVTMLTHTQLITPGATTISADCTGVPVPGILVMGELATEPIKNYWYVDVNNNGHIGDPDNDLFVYIVIGQYRAYYSVYDTEQTLPIQFKVNP